MTSCSSLSDHVGSPSGRFFEEFFFYQLGHAWRRHSGSTELKRFVPQVGGRIRASAASVLPFKVTAGQ